MALILTTDNIEVISRLDSSFDKDKFGIESDEDEDSDELSLFDKAYNEYLEDLDETKLHFKEGEIPTRFIMKRILSYKISTSIKNEQIKMRGKGEMDVRIGTTMMEEVRASLIDIKHPEGTDAGNLVFKRENDQRCSMELMALLEAHGIVGDLYKARQSSLGKGKANVSKKKSVRSLNSPSPATSKEKVAISPAKLAP